MANRRPDMMRCSWILLAFLSLSADAQIILLHRGGSGNAAPVQNGAAAALATANNNSLCTAISPFYAAISNFSGSVNWSTAVNVVLPGWVSSTAYSVGARVSYGTSNYLAIQASTNQLPTVTAYWKSLGAVYPATPMNSATGIGVASASKFQYAAYVTAIRGGASNFTTADIAALNFTDGYTNMGSETAGSQCSTSATYCATPVPNPSPAVNSVNNCLAICGINNPSQPNSYQNPATIGVFNYDSGHQENHASANQSTLGIANLATNQIYLYYQGAFGQTTSSGLGTFTEPLLSGGIYQTPAHYLGFLNAFVNSSTMMSILSPSYIAANAVCAWLPGIGSGCGTCTGTNGCYSPISEKWYYVAGYWWEADPSNNNDFSISSPGAYGAYPFVMPLCPAAGHAGNLCTTSAEFTAAGSSPWVYYGMLAQFVPTGSSPTGNGQASGACMQKIRKAFLTGVQQ
jgi:hypothetical protein